MYTKKDHITFQSLNQRYFSKIYHVIGTVDDFKQMEPLRDTRD